jgi:Prokaryotic homologs of the JAB domain
MAEFYATLDDAETSKLMFDPEEGLTRMQVGQGCGSLSMPMTDARLSAMSATVTEVITGCMDEPKPIGTIYVAISAPKLPTTVWRRQEVPPFVQIQIEGGAGWVLRLSPRIAAMIRQEAAAWPAVETGGVIMGVASARLKVVTVVDVLPAPIDSQRSAAHFLLGTVGLQAAIEARHESSGQTLFDIGTWHSHLSDQGPSPTDWATAAKLTSERAPPSVLMIVTPRRFLAIMASGDENG